MLEQAMQMDYDTMFLKASDKAAFEEKKKQEDENSPQKGKESNKVSKMESIKDQS